MITINNLTKGLTIDFDSHPFLITKIDFSTSETTHYTSRGIGQHGEIITGSKLEPRDIPLIGYILNSTDVEVDKRQLNKFFSPLDEIEIIKDNKYKISGKLTSTVKFGTGKEEGKFSVTLFAPQPFFCTVEADKQSIAAWEPKFTFPFAIMSKDEIVFGSRIPKSIIEIINEGDVNCGLICEFVAKGSVTNPKIYDMVTNKEMQLRYTMSEGERIIMNTNYGSKSVTSINGDVERDLIGVFNFFTNWDFIQLQPGLNSIGFSADSNADKLEVYITHSPKFLGVE